MENVESNVTYMLVGNEIVQDGSNIDDILHGLPLFNHTVSHEPAIATTIEEYNQLEL